MYAKTRVQLTLRALPVLIIAASIASTQAAPIITPNGSVTSAASITASVYAVQRFSLTDAWTNVAISASLIGLNTTATGTAYLTNQFGAGTTLANQLAATSFNFSRVANLSTLVSVDLFSGLTLSPGTYYLTIASAVTTFGQGISVDPAMTFTTAPGVTVGPGQLINTGLNNGFPPASTGTVLNSTAGNRFFTVTGDLAASEIPEPSTVLLISAGLLATVTLRRKSR